jgi:polysaccharide pyruvyl transferase CsaB
LRLSLSKEKPRIVLSNTYGHANIGDEAILFSMIADTGARLKADITLLSLFPERTRMLHSQVRVLYSGVARGMSNTYIAVKEADLLVVGGGGIIQDSTTLGNLLFHLSRVAMAIYTQTPFMCYAISVGPLHRQISSLLTAKLLAKAARITVRDELSATLLASIGVPEELIEVTADPVLLLDFPNRNTASAYKKLAQVKQTGKAVLGVSLRPAVGRARSKSNVLSRLLEEEALLDHVADAARHFIYRNNGHVAFYSMHAGQDDSLGLRLRARLETENSFTFFPGTLSPPTMMSAVGLSDYFIGMRLHSLIFAARSHIPLIALGYAPKVHGFIQLLGQDKYILDKAEWTGSALTSALEALSSCSSSIRHELREAVPALQRRAERNGEVMAHLVQKR